MNLPLILLAFFLTAASPGPATLAIAGTSMASGRKLGMTLGLGVFCGSVTWNVSAAFGLAAIMLAHAWVFEVMRYLGAAYLLYLAVLSARAAWRPSTRKAAPVRVATAAQAFHKGLALQVTNPKAILFYGSLYSIGLPQETAAGQLLLVMSSLMISSFCLFVGYGWLFSIPKVRQIYTKTEHWFNGLFAIVFGAVGLKLLTTRFV